MWIHEYSSPNNNPYTESPFVRLKSLSYIDNLPVWMYPFHSHADDFELIFVMEGKGSLELHSRSVPISDGDLAIIPPGTMHHMSVKDQSTMKYCTIGFRLPDSPASAASAALYENTTLKDFFLGLGIAQTSTSTYAGYFQDSFRLLFNIHQSNGGRADETMQTIVLGMLQLARQFFTNKALLVRLDDNHSAADIVNYIMETSGKGVTLESLADHFHVSQSHLSRIFCNAYHVSPINYAINARVTNATEYLMKSDLPVNQIAALCGYDNPVHFTNMFVKRIGCTPAEYRERNRGVPFNEAPDSHDSGSDNNIQKR